MGLARWGWPLCGGVGPFLSLGMQMAGHKGAMVFVSCPKWRTAGRIVPVCVCNL